MNDAATPAEIRLERSESRFGRLVFGGLASLVLLWGLVQFTADRELTNAELLLLMSGIWFSYMSIFRSDVAWTIGNQEIRIDRRRPFDRTRTEIIKGNGIVGMQVRDKSGEGGPKYCVELQFSSDRILKSPPISDVKRAYEISSEIARQLGLQDIDPEPAENPLDAINAEIRLGKPVDPKRGRGHKVLIVLLACVLSFPFVHALGNGELSALGVTVWSLGAIAAVVLFRYAHRMSDPFWIIQDRGIQVEWLSLKGATEVETIGGGDVETINIENGGPDDGFYVIAIRLRTGRKIRSPALAGKDQTRALRAEIVRRLGLNLSGAG
jgi:hypothetical protein